MKKKEKIYVKTKNLYSKTLDICDILKKIQEIDKLKAILFSSKQNILFNFMTKPLIDEDSLSNSTSDLKLNSKKSRALSKIIHSDINKNINEATKIINDLKKSEKISEIDRRLLALVEKHYAKNKV